ncbi:tetratricopeptide repeat protein [Leptolyngbyaceae cyanobacterium UHCC 1019]
MQIGVAQPTDPIERYRLDQRLYLPMWGLSAQSSSCVPSPKTGTEIYKFIIFNKLLGNSGFGRIDFSSIPYQDAYQRNPRDPVINLELGDAFLAEYFHHRNKISADLEARFYRDATKAYQNTLNLAKDDILKAFANLGLGRVSTLQERYREAIEYYQAAIQIAENARPLSDRKNTAVSADAYVGMGVALGGLCKHNVALDAYLKAVEMNLGHPEIDFLNLSGVLKARNRLSDMVTIYQRAIQRNPKFFGNYASLGDLLAEQGNLTEAISNYRRAIQLNPNSPYSYYSLSNALVNQGNLDEAITNLRRAAQLAPDDAEIQNALKKMERRQ